MFWGIVGLVSPDSATLHPGYLLIQGADHALPFQKPEIIAELMNADLNRSKT